MAALRPPLPMSIAQPLTARTGHVLKRTARIVLAAVLFATIVASPTAAQDDAPPEGSNPLRDDHSPSGALWRAAALPGWGQYYNRQYIKIPVVWIGIGGLAASALTVNHRYLLHRHAYHFLARRDADGNPLFPEYEDDFERLTRDIPRERALQLAPDFRRIRDNLRRNRDLLYIGVGLFYGLTILDAYVNAHLLDFDVGEDLTLGVHPLPTGFAATLRLGR